jgi:hypothetical protein
MKIVKKISSHYNSVENQKKFSTKRNNNHLPNSITKQTHTLPFSIENVPAKLRSEGML